VNYALREVFRREKIAEQIRMTIDAGDGIGGGGVGRTFVTSGVRLVTAAVKD